MNVIHHLRVFVVLVGKGEGNCVAWTLTRVVQVVSKEVGSTVEWLCVCSKGAKKEKKQETKMAANSKRVPRGANCHERQDLA